MPAFILAVSLTITATAAYYLYASAQMVERHRFANLVQDARDQANRSLARYLSVLQSTVGLYAAADQADGPAFGGNPEVGRLDRRSFDAYAAALDLANEYHGLRRLGFLTRVTPENRDAFLRVARRESGADFNIRAEPNPTTAPVVAVPAWTGDAFVARYVGPALGAHPPILGYDMASDPYRRAAMIRACDTAAAVVTPGMLLVRANDGLRHAGFVIFIPIYGPNGVPASVEARRREVTGFIFATFWSNDLFEHIVNSNVNARLRMQVYDGETPGTAPPIFDSDPPTSDEAKFQPAFHDRFVLAVAGANWTVSVSERPSFYRESDSGLVPFVITGGIGISLVLFAVARGQAVARSEAERTAAVFQQAQRALAASQSRLRRLVDANLIGVFFCDLGGEVSGGNDEFFRLLGQERGGDGRPLVLGDITVVDARESIAQALRQVGRDGVAPAFETAFVRPTGPPVPVLLGVASVYPSDAGHIPGAEAVAFALDLSDRHRAEQELRSAKEAAEKANRSKDQFLAMLSHELRTPLTPVLAATAEKAVDPSLPPAVRDDLAMIHRNVELEARLIDDLLDLTRIGRGKLQLRTETVDVHRVIADAVAVVPAEDFQDKQLVVERHLAAPAHHVHGDAARLQQVFWNLVKNAVKFTPPGGRISIRTSNPDAGRLRIEVTDTGLGIEADILPKLFDAFEQGSAARAQASGGLGLGLAISRGLVEAHGGQIRAQSPGAGRGATFAVELATVAKPASAVPAPADGRPADAVVFRILLVEDHLDTARVMARLLGRSGHAVSVAHCVADALRLAGAEPFDVLVSDLGLPDGSGTDVVRGFRRCQASAGDAGRLVGAIALTGFGAEDDVNRTRSAGFDEHLTKPVSFELLMETIARVMECRGAGVG